ncbi:PQQ-binding-like beta-propeller repeat protein [Litorivita sp. NS0012-18]|uniref:PQQ-binding-like beta-propeller repeat protein n=1 Tax=Litorivita sp. NS0012-18 TaxID=3127655 RepID=UPI00310725C8
MQKKWITGLMGGLLAATVLSGCDESEIILQGKRENPRAILGGVENTDVALPENTVAAVNLPTMRQNSDWTQGPGSPATRTDHAALSATPALVWSANIGQGDSRRGRITADPVVAGGRIYTLDSQALVSATSTAGVPLWSTDLVPAHDSGKDASGGGLAYADGTLYVSSGFGRLTALDAATGAQLWQQKLDATGSGTPTVKGDLIYLVAGDSTGWAIERRTGRVRWQIDATPDINNIMGAPAPAVTDQFALFAFGSGEVQATFAAGGLRRWDALLTGKRAGFARAEISDITGDPVISGNTVYVGTNSGRLIALDLGSGERLWTAEQSAQSAPWVAGGDVFAINDSNELVRLTAATGERVWSVKLPFFTKGRPKRQREIFAHHGPVLAGGRLLVASSDGILRSYDPKSGDLVAQTDLPGGATTDPVVAGGTAYVVNTKGQLLALR